MAAYIYENPPEWFTTQKGNKDAVLKLTAGGWVACFPNGKKEIVVALKNVPKEFWTDKPVETKKPEPVPAPEPTPAPVEEHKVEEEPVAEAPKKKGRSKKAASTEE